MTGDQKLNKELNVLLVKPRVWVNSQVDWILPVIESWTDSDVWESYKNSAPTQELK